MVEEEPLRVDCAGQRYAEELEETSITSLTRDGPQRIPGINLMSYMLANEVSTLPSVHLSIPTYTREVNDLVRNQSRREKTIPQ